LGKGNRPDDDTEEVHMTKVFRYAVLAAVLVLALALPAAAGIVDLNPFDANSIISWGENGQNLGVLEEYNETYLVPYPSHDGWAIVNSGLYPGQTSRFFDKVVQGLYTHINFAVHNSENYIWSDYHFEFWDETFTQTRTPTLVGWSSSLFTNSSYVGNTLSFWAPGWQNPGATSFFDLFFQAPLTEPLGIRQVATTPVPPAVWLFGSGLLGLAGWRHRRRKN
jgi:hypothetical protein